VECVKDSALEGTEEIEKVHVRDLTRGDHFGELALINHDKRSLSVRVKSENGAKVLALGRSTFVRILGNIGKYLKKDYDGVFDKQFKIAHP